MSAVNTKSLVIESQSQEECRACLRACCPNGIFLFQPWSSRWGETSTTIAQDLANIANVQVSETDKHSKFICISCADQLKAACQFISLVQINYQILLQRNINDAINCEGAWPRPIQVDKSLAFDNWLDIDIKQEVLSENEYDNTENEEPRQSSAFDQVEIKVEPEEIVKPHSPRITMNGDCTSHSSSNNIVIENGDCGEKFLDTAVKDEPLSDTEDKDALPEELPLECLLCTRTFLSISGLKAHVIAQHSYKTVQRKIGADSPRKTPKAKFTCAICKRSFSTTTDLMVHETCHNKDVCYGCNAKFDSFDKLSAHRKRCKALSSKEVVKPKTLDDVIRPQTATPENKIENKTEKTETTTDTLSCDKCSEVFSGSYYLTIHQEIHHTKENSDLELKSEPAPMEIETLKNIFNDNT